MGPGAIRGALEKKKYLAHNGIRNLDRPERKRGPEGNANVTRDRDTSGAVTHCHGLNVGGLCKGESVHYESDIQQVYSIINGRLKML